MVFVWYFVYYVYCIFYGIFMVFVDCIFMAFFDVMFMAFFIVCLWIFFYGIYVLWYLNGMCMVFLLYIHCIQLWVTGIYCDLMVIHWGNWWEIAIEFVVFGQLSNRNLQMDFHSWGTYDQGKHTWGSP